MSREDERFNGARDADRTGRGQPRREVRLAEDLSRGDVRRQRIAEWIDVVRDLVAFGHGIALERIRERAPRRGERHQSEERSPRIELTSAGDHETESQGGPR